MPFAVFFAAAAAFGGMPKVVTDAVVVVYVQGHGVLPGGAWFRTKQMVSSMFEVIALYPQWKSGVPPANASNYPERLIVQVLISDGPLKTRAEQRNVCGNPIALACSYPFRPSNPTVIIMYEQMRVYSRRQELLVPVLAHVLVHEMAHIMQASESHSSAGVMKATWTAADYFQMPFSPLQFTARDVELIQTGFDQRRGRKSPVN